ncbi:MAG: hypothetical protein NTV12_02010, partial [Verrucomicrobia bacterium]|nr:hypothetical protein [Verrucomicrobiota bacterium]
RNKSGNKRERDGVGVVKWLSNEINGTLSGEVIFLMAGCLASFQGAGWVGGTGFGWYRFRSTTDYRLARPHGVLPYQHRDTVSFVGAGVQQLKQKTISWHFPLLSKILLLVLREISCNDNDNMDQT